MAAADEDGPMAAAAPGRTVAGRDRGPPWIVVCADPSRVIPKWPGRLWLAEIADPATGADMARHGGRPRRDAGYTRAVAVTIISEAPMASLFGDHGEAVVALLSRAERLDAEQVGRLAAARVEGAGAANDRAWKNWAAANRPELDAGGRDLADTLYWEGSPINWGFLTLHDLISRRAELLVGEAAFEDDDESRWLVAPWSCAASAFLDAAMALGAPEIVAAADRPLLLHAYQAVFGRL